MTAYRWVYDSRHLQADCQELGSAPEPYMLDNVVWATYTFYSAPDRVAEYRDEDDLSGTDINVCGLLLHP